MLVVESFRSFNTQRSTFNTEHSIEKMLGEGIIKGMAVPAKNFLGSYVSEERLTTIQYPEERQVLPEAVRQFPFLVFDGNDPMAGLRCVACQICEKECP